MKLDGKGNTAGMQERYRTDRDMSERTLFSQGASAFQVVLAVCLLPGIGELPRVPSMHHLHKVNRCDMLLQGNKSDGPVSMQKTGLVMFNHHDTSRQYSVEASLMKQEAHME